MTQTGHPGLAPFSRTRAAGRQYTVVDITLIDEKRTSKQQHERA